MAAENTNSPSTLSRDTSTNPAVRLPDVMVTGRQDSLPGIADSTTQGTTGAAQLADRPILRSGEILETMPGVIITQHTGGGKANQYFLRGFNPMTKISPMPMNPASRQAPRRHFKAFIIPLSRFRCVWI